MSNSGEPVFQIAITTVKAGYPNSKTLILVPKTASHLSTGSCNIVPNRVIEYRSLFPLSILAPRNTFLIEPKGENSCIFTATGSLRLPVWLFKKLHKKHKNKIEATEQHMKKKERTLKEHWRINNQPHIKLIKQIPLSIDWQSRAGRRPSVRQKQRQFRCADRADYDVQTC